MKVKLIKKDDNYFLEVDYWYPKFIRPSLIANTFEKPDGDIYNLSKQNCDEVFGVVDVEKLAYDHRRVYQDSFEEMNECIMKDAMHQQVGFVAGFNKAMELYQPTEIEVEIEMKKVVDETKVIGAVKGVKGSGHKTTTYKSVPKLDEDGCLILKTI